MTTKPRGSEEEDRQLLRRSERWRTVLNKQWGAPSFIAGGLIEHRRPTEPSQHWPSLSVTLQGENDRQIKPR